ncbi:GSCFA domain-containing protein [Rhizobium sp. AC27/96]|uniref:GSCFA domain-containing protein n=1 Tax=Rhizobium sp. AC27/96 TaxID=1841653 RepID=UPI000828BA16|nr:GSCFA domain-containing protein [Rhizobium sp. AC27/96]OCJ07721.1 GSCFA domain-containing protein [Rhizobium sp. AC27/96]
MKSPYHSLPAYTRWKKAIAEPDYPSVDPVTNFPWKIANSDKVATAGSCFAQHIARHLKQSGFDHYVVEDGHPLADEHQRDHFNYGTYSARYGNIYTPRQLVQLFERAFGTFEPQEEIWTNEHGKFVDPFRPNIEPEGFATKEELVADRHQHLAKVRDMFSTLDVFVFTLGLTEAWLSKTDGAVFPVCPGVAGGTFDVQKYEFHNFRVSEVIADLERFLDLLNSVNPKARVILTVSPVPLMATAENRHVLTSTTYSKSALRVACDEIERAHKHVVYFPSYEVITGAYNRGRYFAEDLRNANEEGVSHVMRIFLQHATQAEAIQAPAPKVDEDRNFIERMMHVVQTTCEEELIEVSLSRR